jgi:WD40 repeat protein
MRAAVHPETKTIYYFHPETRETTWETPPLALFSVLPHGTRVLACAYDAARDVAATAGFHRVCLWNGLTGERLHIFDGCGHNFVAFTAKGQLLADQNSFDSVSLCDLETKDVAQSKYAGFGGARIAGGASADGLVFIACEDGSFRLFNEETGVCLSSFQHHRAGELRSVTMKEGLVLLASKNAGVMVLRPNDKRALRYHGADSGGDGGGELAALRTLLPGLAGALAGS